LTDALFVASCKGSRLKGDRITGDADGGFAFYDDRRKFVIRAGEADREGPPLGYTVGGYDPGAITYGADF